MTKIPLTNSEEFTVVDDIYAEEALKHTWCLQFDKSGGKHVFVTDSERISLHCFIAILAKLPNPFPKQIVDLDHRDNDGLNNQIENLRYIPHSENIRRGKERNNPNKNICKIGDAKYRVRVMINRLGIHVGVYTTIEEAREARDSFIKSKSLITN